MPATYQTYTIIGPYQMTTIILFLSHVWWFWTLESFWKGKSWPKPNWKLTIYWCDDVLGPELVVSHFYKLGNFRSTAHMRFNLRLVSLKSILLNGIIIMQSVYSHHLRCETFCLTLTNFASLSRLQTIIFGGTDGTLYNSTWRHATAAAFVLRKRRWPTYKEAFSCYLNKWAVHIWNVSSIVAVLALFCQHVASNKQRIRTEPYRPLNIPEDSQLLQLEKHNGQWHQR